GAVGEREDNRLVALENGVDGRVDQSGGGQRVGREHQRARDGGVVGAVAGRAGNAVVHRGGKRRGVIQRHRVGQIGRAVLEHRARSNRNRGGDRIVFGDGAGRHRRVASLPTRRSSDLGAVGEREDNRLVALENGVDG